MKLSRIFSRPVPLRWHLVVLVVGTLLPVVAFTALVVLRLANHERTAVERRLQYSARMMAASVDNEMLGTIRALHALAASETLDRLDLAGFYDEAKLVRSTQPYWLAVMLVAPDGQQLVDTSLPWGTPLSRVYEPESLERVVATLAAAVGDLAHERPELGLSFAVRVPIIRGNELRYVLSAIVKPQALNNTVTTQLPPDQEWTRTVIDRQGLIVARTRSPERYVGMRSTKNFYGRIQRSADGVYQELTMEGKQGYLAFSRAPFSGWTAAVVVPLEVVEEPLRSSMLAIAGVGLVLLIMSGTGAFILSRRLSLGIESVAEAAEALAHGSRPATAQSEITEVARLGESLERSAELLIRREQERDHNLSRAVAARAEAETASRVKDEFLAMLGHELRNPLSPIVTALELLEMRGQGETREVVVIRRQVQHMVRLIEDLLDVSRITRGKVHLEKQPLEIAPVVARALEMASPLLEQRQHRLSVDVPAMGLEVSGDPDRLAQVVANLLTNAAKYTSPGGSIRVRGWQEGEQVVLAVSDSGQGLSAEMLPQVFDLFVQGPRSPDRPEGGLGVGLTLVRSLVAMHGGEVLAYSEGLHRGCTFTVKLPRLVRAAQAAEAAATPATPRPRPGSRARRILIVDDNVDGAELLSALFVHDGHDVVTAHDGPAALAMLDAFSPEVAVLDIGLPVMDGYELAGRIREKLGPAAPAFVAVTGYGQEQDVARSRVAGFQRHFVKPVDLAALVATVETLAAERERTMDATPA
jgi:signal transduction histidine kinase/ActR/RegA family two-component response regulator